MHGAETVGITHTAARSLILSRAAGHDADNPDHGSVEAHRHGITRSGHWPHVRDEAIIARGGMCELSGATTEIEVHHVIPFHFGALLKRGYIELDPRNLFLVSRGPVNFHLYIAHAGCFKSFNMHVRAKASHGKHPVGHFKSNEEIQACHEWQILALHRPKSWAEMTGEDKTRLCNIIDHLYPIR
jgi:hypothetical protein